VIPPDSFPLLDETAVAARFYDAAAERYDREVDGQEPNASRRDAFRAYVSMMAGTGCTLLDFGCGTGTDAAWYAEHGHRVIAYDISQGMIGALRDRCAAQIADGTVLPLVGDIGALMDELNRTGPVAAVTANFGVLNHIRDLRPLINMLAPHLTPDGLIVADVLSPFYWRDMGRRWWWKGVLGSAWTGAIRVVGEVTTYRHYVRTVSRMGEPRFSLVACGRPVMIEGSVPTIRAAWRQPLADNFLTLVLRRRP
jgi:SAM-dependent methyltransferase